VQEDVKTNRIPINKGVRQGDTVSPKLFTLALEDVFRRLDWDKKGLRVDGGYLSDLRFADDIVLIISTKEELIEMLTDLKRESGKIGFNMNIDKSKLLTPDPGDVHLKGQQIEKVNEYIYLGHTITLGKENQTAEITGRIRLTWAAVGKLGTTLRKPTLPINLKKKVFNTCVLPVLTYGMETMTLTVKSANTLRTTQAIERTMLGVSLKDHIQNEEIRKGKLEQDNDRWTRRIVQWRPRQHKRSAGRPQKRWIDDIKEMAGRKWHQMAMNRSE